MLFYRKMLSQPRKINYWQNSAKVCPHLPLCPWLLLQNLVYVHTKLPAPLTAAVLQKDDGFSTKALQDITDILAVRLQTVSCLLCLLVWQSCEAPCVTVGYSIGPPASPMGVQRRGVQGRRHHAIASRGDGVRPLSSVTTGNTPHIPHFGHRGKK